MRARRIFLTAILGAWLAALAVIALPLRLELAHSYAHWLGPANAPALPWLTRAFALPVLRGGESAAAGGVFALYWALVWLAPVALAVRIWRVRDATALLETWSYGGGAYALLVAASWCLMAFGLWLPFALM